ncbi:glucose-1-dehydrogenase [Ferroplasma acidiphilum]|uniref:Glucose-1-dehydrogenase n=1 Tax=Ferroplasma acidiphilum TaxID=74969 RepID=A0A1V0N4M6_9ARCH|nr:glucose 1-dehydrogenase [Ferroplasma acidiphilum]ARD85088.1 glucose-1-dehydrogenase [Ferroplasma acidiphilum]
MEGVMTLTTSAPGGGISYGRINMPDYKDGKAKIRPVYTGICGTDRAEIAGHLPFAYNPTGQNYMVIGHEAVCQVIDIGENNSRIRPGDYVIPIVRRRGTCINCRIGRQDNCSDADNDITEAGIRGADGFNSEYFFDSPENLIKVNDSSMAMLSTLTEPAKNVMKAFEIFDKLTKRSIFEAEDSTYISKNCLIIGTGSEAFLYAFMAREYDMTVYLTNRHRLLEEKMGIIEGIHGLFYNYLEENGPDKIDLLIDTSGDPAAVMKFVKKLNYNGIAILFGTNGAAPNSQLTGNDLNYIIEHNIAISGSVDGSKKHYMDAIGYLEKWRSSSGGIINKLITGIYKPEDTEIFRAKPPEEIKSIIKW